MNEMSKRTLEAIPETFPVRPLTTQAEIEAAGDPMQDGQCGLWWDDSIATTYTPTPAGRCPFEGFHAEEEPQRTARDILEEMRSQPDWEDVGPLVTTLEKVLALHTPGEPIHWHGYTARICRCGKAWPCETVEMIETEIRGAGR